MKKQTWKNQVKDIMVNLGGRAHLSNIYNEIGQKMSGDLPRSWKQIIQKTIEDHSSDSMNFQGRENCFYSVAGIGSGVWGLRETTESAENTEVQS